MRVNQVYRSINSNHSYSGYNFEVTELTQCIRREVLPLVYDDAGTDELVGFLSSMTSTGFNPDSLRQSFGLQNSLSPEFWRIGEALAERFLEEHRGHVFYVNHIRDARNPKAGLQGADIVGFLTFNEKTLFVFGEVKSSEDTNVPPQVLYGRSGMINQLEDLSGTNSSKKNNLIRYLTLKVMRLDDADPFKRDFIEAYKIFALNHNEMVLCGVLVRTTDVNENDLRPRYETLRRGKTNDTIIDLIALYIPMSFSELESLAQQKS